MNKEMNFDGLFKDYQRLVQDYHQVKKGTEAAKTKLELMKQRRLTLLAEVRFLRQRHKHLLEMEAANPFQEQNLLHHLVSQTRHNSHMMQNNGRKKEMKLQTKSPKLDLNLKEMSSRSKKSALKINDTYINRKENHLGNEAFLRNTKLGFNVNQKEGQYGAKEVTFKHPSEVRHWNRTERTFVGGKTNSQKKDLGFDLNQMEKSYAVTKEAVPNRAPAFDLNLKLGEEDMQENNETSTLEEPANLFSGGSEEQSNDLKLSVCRNVETVPNHSGKRKISWQDPVALKV